MILYELHAKMNLEAARQTAQDRADSIGESHLVRIDRPNCQGYQVWTRTLGNQFVITVQVVVGEECLDTLLRFDPLLEH